MNKKMKSAQVSKPGAAWELVERDIPEPGPRQVRVKVEACGICHSDVLVKEGWWPGIQYPRVPGHEIAGRIDALGSGVTAWKPGQRVGVGWHGGHCFVCEHCRRGDFAMCAQRKVTGIDFDPAANGGTHTSPGHRPGFRPPISSEALKARFIFPRSRAPRNRCP